MTAVHKGAGVLPGRYPGDPIPLHDGPTAQQMDHDAAKRAADALAGRIGAAAALSAQSECRLLELVGEFDATDAIRFWTDVKWLAHWLAWSCSMKLGVAREHVRVARTLWRMPTVTEAFRTGRLSYSKVRLPKEEAAVVLSAMDTARDQFGPPPAKPDQTLDEVTSAPMYGRADALVDVARSFTNCAPADRSGEDHHLVVVHVDADLLTDLPAGKESKDVPAGTSQAQGAVCHIQGVGSVEPATAQRLACDSTLLGALTNSDGEVLRLGRTRRLVSKAQRRALTIRDQMCRYPGCAQTRHLDAHHVIPWAVGGPTDLDKVTSE